jgi:hypothetical protein
MAKLHDIMKPIDERKEFKTFWAQKKFQDEKKKKPLERDAQSIIERREENRKLKLERFHA